VLREDYYPFVENCFQWAQLSVGSALPWDWRVHLKGHVGPVFGTVFPRGGSFMANCGADSTVQLWPAATLEEPTRPQNQKRKTNDTNADHDA
jgi:hypothetical protein